ncbi:MAG: HAMP domain-containing protein [Euryarchaeota archaeon]|nr:HAMP domain-containing protein [Euryarchaeota archaeon]
MADRERIGIREKILAAFVVLSLIPLVFLGAVSSYEMGRVGKRSVEESTDALESQAETHLRDIARDKAGFSDGFFLGIRKDATMLQSYASDLFTNRDRYGRPAYPAFRYATNLAANLPAYGYLNTSAGEGNGSWADWDHRLASSPYLNRSVVSKAASDPVYASWVSAEMNSTMLLDKMLAPTYERNKPNVVATWFVRSGGPSTSYQEPPLDWGAQIASGKVTADWDESSEEYFRAATPGRDPARKPVWIDPYYDTVGNGWIISCVAPVYAGPEFIGVIGIDVTLDVVVAEVLEVSVLGTGHAFLINSAGDAIAHRDLVAAMGASDGNPVPITSLETASPQFSSALARMRAGEKGLQKVVYSDGKGYHLAYAPVPSTGLSLGVVIPVDEVSRPVRDTQDEINSLTSTTIYQVVAIDAVAIVLAVVLGMAVAGRIVRPIKRLSDLAAKIGTGELDEKMFDSGELNVETELTDRPDEMGELARSFEGMINSIREDIRKTPKSEIKIEIKDSVISRSFTDMGADSKDTLKKEMEGETAGVGAGGEPVEVVEMKDAAVSGAVVSRGQLSTGAPAMSICPYCGKELNFPKPPRFCPYCKERLH